MGEVEEDIIQAAYDKTNPKSKIIVKEVTDNRPALTTLENDNLDHSYQIVGTWSRWQPDDMTPQEDGSYTYEITIGENAWEEFYVMQDKHRDKLICPAYARSWKSMPCIGPAADQGRRWLLDTRDAPDVPEVDIGEPGDRFLVTFSWTTVKNVYWERLPGKGEYKPGQYCISGSWTCWENIFLDAVGDGHYCTDVQMTSLGLEFTLMRNEDRGQMIYPDGVAGFGTALLGPMEPERSKWRVDGVLGDVFRIDFFRSPDFPDEMELTWTKVDTRTVLEPPVRYFLVGTPNDWGARGLELVQDEANRYTVDIEIINKTEEFRILENNLSYRCVYPDKEGCTQFQAHAVSCGDGGENLFWSVGKAASDKARYGDTFTIVFDVVDNRISWHKRM